MARKTEHKKLHSMIDIFGEMPDEYFFTLTPDAKTRLLVKAEDLEVTESFVVEALIRVGLSSAIAYYKENGFDSKENKRFKAIKRYGQKKQHKSLSLTDTSNKKLDHCATLINESRSEVLECAIRSKSAMAEAVKLIIDLLINSN